MHEFILQFDRDVCLKERRAVEHACMIRNDMQIAGRQNIDDLRRIPFGALAEQRMACPVGTVEFCLAWMHAVGIPEPEPVDYPDILRDALGRDVRRMPFSEVAAGMWVKPIRTKAWDAHIKRSDDELPGDELVWASEAISREHWLAEWRVYVVSGVWIGAGRYDDGLCEDVRLNTEVVQSWIERFEASGQAPVGYALDVALLSDGRTILVEVTDGWALGYYRGDCAPAHYATLLSERWREIATKAVFLERSAA